MGAVFIPRGVDLGLQATVKIFFVSAGFDERFVVEADGGGEDAGGALGFEVDFLGIGREVLPGLPGRRRGEGGERDEVVAVGAGGAAVENGAGEVGEKFETGGVGGKAIFGVEESSDAAVGFDGEGGEAGGDRALAVAARNGVGG